LTDPYRYREASIRYRGRGVELVSRPSIAVSVVVIIVVFFNNDLTGSYGITPIVVSGVTVSVERPTIPLIKFVPESRCWLIVVAIGMKAKALTMSVRW